MNSAARDLIETFKGEAAEEAFLRALARSLVSDDLRERHWIGVAEAVMNIQTPLAH